MMDMRRLLAYTNHIVPSLLALAVCLFSGCEKSATQKVTDDLGNDFISFSGGTSDGYAVKSEDGSTPTLATTDILKGKPFGIFGGKSYDGTTNFSSVFRQIGRKLWNGRKKGLLKNGLMTLSRNGNVRCITVSVQSGRMLKVMSRLIPLQIFCR